MAEVGRRPLKELRDVSPAEWRTWLDRHGASESGVWLRFFKKHTGKGRITYDEAVEEALCFGWIDGTLKRVDEETHKIRFTPRRRKSTWADSNLRRVRRLIREGRMTERGLAVIDRQAMRRNVSAGARPRRRYRLAGEMRTRLLRHPAAWAAYRALSPSRREQVAYWLMAARREETKAKRIDRAIEMLESGMKGGMLW